MDNVQLEGIRQSCEAIFAIIQTMPNGNPMIHAVSVLTESIDNAAERLARDALLQAEHR